jgi:hypothetical protein
MSESKALFGVMRQAADANCTAAIEHAVCEAGDRELCRVNVLNFAAKRGLDEEKAIAAFLHAARLGLFELSWNVLCSGCGGSSTPAQRCGLLIVKNMIVCCVRRTNSQRSIRWSR